MHQSLVNSVSSFMSREKDCTEDFFNSIDIGAALSTFGDNQSSVFFIMDREHRFRYVNSRLTAMIGCEIEQALGKTDVEIGLPHELLFGDPDGSTPGVHILDEQAMVTGESTCTMDGKVDLGIGRYESSVIIRTPLKNSSGEVVGLLIQCIDDTDLSRLEQQVQSTNKSLISLDEDLVALDSILADLMSCSEVQVLLDRIAENVVARTTADGAYIACLDESSGKLVGTVANGKYKDAFLAASFDMGEGFIGKAWEGNAPIFSEDATKDGAFLQFEEKTQLLALPIMSQGKLVAALAVVSHTMENNLAREVPGLTRIAGMAGIALANAQLLAANNATLKQTHELSAVSRQIMDASNELEACSSVCRMMLNAFDIVEATSVLMDSTGELKFSIWRAVQGRPALMESMDSVVYQQSFVRWCIDNDKQAVICHNQGDFRETADVGKLLFDRGIGSTFCVPLNCNESAIGALLISRVGSNFDDAMLGVFRTATNQLSTAFERQALSKALHHQAFHDRLTGFPNRHFFEKKLEKALLSSADKELIGAVLFIDLDGFKEINDTLGHAVGDKLLRAVAQRFSEQIRTGDVLSRMGGDEFAALIPNVAASGEVTVIADRLLGSLAESFIIDNTEIKIGASVGVSQYPVDGNSIDDLLRSADMAMYQAKQSGKGKVLYFDEAVSNVMLRRSWIQNELREALGGNQFELHYQPQVCCKTGDIRGLEALLRWMHPQQGNISPAEFIPIAEESGLIASIGAWVLDEAIAQLAAWKGTEFDGVRVSVNIAASQFENENFVELVMGSIAAYKVDATLLELEVTEHMLMDNIATVVSRFETLRGAGIRIAIDDFGTGYSSLSYLQDLPLDVLKIDRAFVVRLQDEPLEQSLAKTITILASGLGLETIAEGVETIEQRDAVISLGCHLIQGFFYSKPLAPSELCGITVSIRELFAAPDVVLHVKS